MTKKEGCPFHHGYFAAPIKGEVRALNPNQALDIKAGTTYPKEIILKAVHLINNDLPPMLELAAIEYLNAVKTAYQTRPERDIPDSAIKAWEAKMVKLIAKSIIAKADNEYALSKDKFRNMTTSQKREFLDGTSRRLKEATSFEAPNGSLPLAGVMPEKWIPEEWLPVIAEFGPIEVIMIGLGGTITRIKLRIEEEGQKPTPQKLVKIAEDCLAKINFETNHNDFRVICKGKMVSESIIFATVLNWFLILQNIDYHIASIKKKGEKITRKSTANIAKEYLALFD